MIRSITTIIIHKNPYFKGFLYDSAKFFKVFLSFTNFENYYIINFNDFNQGGL